LSEIKTEGERFQSLRGRASEVRKLPRFNHTVSEGHTRGVSGSVVNRGGKAEAAIGAAVAAKSQTLVGVERMVKVRLSAKILPSLEWSVCVVASDLSCRISHCEIHRILRHAFGDLSLASKVPVFFREGFIE